MNPASFELVRATSIGEALDAVSSTDDATFLAGGQSLVPLLKLRIARPALVVDIGGLAFRDVVVDATGIRIGALTTYDGLLRAAAVVGLRDSWKEAAGAVGDLQTRNVGTIGGALAHGDPASDLAAAAIASGSHVVLRSERGSRELPVTEFFLGVFTTALRPGELITEIVVPRRREGEGSAYVSLDDGASGYPLAGVATEVHADHDEVTSCALGLTGFGATPLHVALEPAAIGDHGKTDVEILDRSLRAAAPGLEAYRHHLVVHVATEAVARAWSRAQGRPR